MTRLEEIIVEHTRLAREFAEAGLGVSKRKQEIKSRIEELRAERKIIMGGGSKYEL